MAINFPDSPSTSDTFVVGDITYVYNGSVWSSLGVAASGGGGVWEENGTKIYYNSGNVGIGASDASESLEVIGNVKASGDFISLSDFSLKENIEPIDDSLNIINGLNGVFFNFIDEDRRQVGFIAQEVEDVLPEVVFESNGIKSVSYAKIVAVLVEAVKELRKEIEELKNGI